MTGRRWVFMWGMREEQVLIRNPFVCYLIWTLRM